MTAAYKPYIMKLILYSVNIIAGLCGLALTMSGLSLMDFAEKFVFSLHKVSVAITAVGLGSFFLSFIGSFAAYNKSVRLLVLHATFIFVIVTMKLTISFYLSHCPDIWTKSLGRAISKEIEIMKNKDWEQNPYLQNLQIDFECCGRYGPADYDGMDLPYTCCPIGTSTCTYRNAYSGCEEPVSTVIKHLLWVRLVFMCNFFSVTDVSAAMLSIAYARAIKQESRDPTLDLL